MIDKQAYFKKEILAATSRESCVAILREIAKLFEMNHATIMLKPGVGDLCLLPLVQDTTLPLEFGREFDRCQYIRHCPVMPSFSQSILPQTWHLGNEGVAGIEWNWPEGLKDLLLRFNLKTGLAILVSSVDSQRFILRFDGNRPALEQEEINLLTVMAIETFDQYDRLRRLEAANADILSSRELEVVRWTAQGKTSSEIAQILSLSDHTINAYMTSAIKKLDCVNRTQLVAQAIRLKLI
ncbi:LuxR C-terminal-related transcriptional regulator [Allorhizobium sp. BGMRC 0089]|uniref:helix-turn-helix transcriptional regulator n=1 Tax=Allorhizobium sonneratiae TaxID=2934936 RepID=UPI0020333CDD|nr:LuxR C-terminal-related transcriptional regulator [Allorhizobium sonneratiae]MCM2291162.1 LuxR C-terminal-related transcriptional regulator [Allorhizobium sonneratiae]